MNTKELSSLDEALKKEFGNTLNTDEIKEAEDLYDLAMTSCGNVTGVISKTVLAVVGVNAILIFAKRGAIIESNHFVVVLVAIVLGLAFYGVTIARQAAKISARQREAISFVIQEIKELRMGDQFSNITGATIINRSVLENAIVQSEKNHGAELAQALSLIATIVEKSGNKEAGELFQEFSTEVAKPEPRRSILQTLWSGLTAALPAVSQTAEVVEKIQRLLNP